jgi:hypothetical protein
MTVVTFIDGKYKEIDNTHGLNHTFSNLDTPMIVVKDREQLEAMGIKNIEPKQVSAPKDFCVFCRNGSYKVLLHGFRLGYNIDRMHSARVQRDEPIYVHFNEEDKVCFLHRSNKIHRYSNIPTLSEEDFFKLGNFENELSESEAWDIWKLGAFDRKPDAVFEKITSYTEMRYNGEYYIIGRPLSEDEIRKVIGTD